MVYHSSRNKTTSASGVPASYDHLEVMFAAHNTVRYSLAFASRRLAEFRPDLGAEAVIETPILVFAPNAGGERLRVHEPLFGIRG
jgi:hypothetical protein